MSVQFASVQELLRRAVWRYESEGTDAHSQRVSVAVKWEWWKRKLGDFPVWCPMSTQWFNALPVHWQGLDIVVKENWITRKADDRGILLQL